MPTISQQKKDKISEQILHYLFTISPQSTYTSAIAKEMARDEEFIKSMLTDLESKKLIVQINKNSKGINYQRRQRWRLSNEAFEVYKKHQSNQAYQHNNAYNSQFSEE
ncbi:MAG: hypothetical protein AABX35_02550 [Nanoarchaeota archaeon]